MAENILDRIPIIDLFCGAGGFTLGATRAGCKVVAGYDADPIAISVHHHNFPKSESVVEDLSNLKLVEIERKFSELKCRGVIGGPPCQGFSLIGKRQLHDPRNKLFFRFFEIVSKLRPEFFVAENVPGLLQPGNADLIKSALSLVKKTHKIIGPVQLNASDFGCPTLRRRVFIIGMSKETQVSEDEFLECLESLKIRESVLVEDALAGLHDEVVELDSAGMAWGRVSVPIRKTAFSRKLRGDLPGEVGHIETVNRLKKESLVSGFQRTIHEKHVEARFRLLGFGETDRVSRARRLDPKGFCPVLRAGTNVDRGSYTALRPIHPFSPRVITAREAARLQTFPDWFRLHPTTWHSQRHIGNSVPPMLSEAVVRAVIKML